jgi:hypothetical protein
VPQKSAEGKVGHAVGKASEALEQPTRLQIWKGESPFSVNYLYRRIAYPERAEVTKHDMPGRKSLGCPVGRLAAVGAIWETTQTQRPEHNEMSASSKTSPRKVAFAERNGKPTHSVLGKADDTGEETGISTRWDRRGRGPGIWGKICRDRVGKNPLAAGAGSNLQRLSDRVKNEGRESQQGLAHESV